MKKVYIVYVYFGKKSTLWKIHKTEAGAKIEMKKHKKADVYMIIYHLHD
jgi:hypothetical protein